MKVEIKEKNYFINWKHLTDGNNKGTICSIILGDLVIAEGKTKLSLKDIFDKKIGRKLSLKRALKDGGFSREERKKVWRSYLDL